MSDYIRHLKGIYLGYVLSALRNSYGKSRYWTNYSIPAASTILAVIDVKGFYWSLGEPAPYIDLRDAELIPIRN
jgi:hypothetical protein